MHRTALSKFMCFFHCFSNDASTEVMVVAEGGFVRIPERAGPVTLLQSPPRARTPLEVAPAGGHHRSEASGGLLGEDLRRKSYAAVPIAGT